MRVVFAGGGTGGHLYPGLAIARALVRIRNDVRPHFVGARRGIERDILPQTEFSYALLDAHPVDRKRPLNNWRVIRGFLSGWRDISVFASAARPALVVGTGGYASAIPLAWARLHGVPIVQHIGDAFPGAAARLFARWSRECYLGFAEAKDHLPKRRAMYIVTGNPIEPPPATRPDRASLMRAWNLPLNARVILVFGGSQGSHAINEVIAEWAPQHLPDGWFLIWATGRSEFDQYSKFAGPRVRIVPYLSPIANAYAVANIAVVRGGMMGTAELCAWGVPMIIVPLPTAAADHQTWNAKSLEAAGAAVHLSQRAFHARRLDDVVRSLVSDRAKLIELSRNALAHARPNAAADIAQRIASLLPAPGAPR